MKTPLQVMRLRDESNYHFNLPYNTVTNKELLDLIPRLYQEGVSTDSLNYWPNKGLLAMLLGTESGAYYVIQPVKDSPCLVTRLAEVPPFYDEYRLHLDEAIVQRQGNPDRDLEVGKVVDILGLSRRGFGIDLDSLYTTTPLVEIKYIEEAC